MKPSMGRIVTVQTREPFNGSFEHPGIITRVWGTNDPAEAKGAHVCVNVKVLPDCGAPFDQTSSLLFETKQEAIASGMTPACWWPERVESAAPKASQDCPHAAPFRYCPECKASPCPIGLDKLGKA